MTALRDAGLGDIIDIASHYPQRVTMMSREFVGLDDRVPLVRLGWIATEAEGTTTLSEDTKVRVMWAAPDDAPVKRQATAGAEAALTAMLTGLEG